MPSTPYSPLRRRSLLRLQAVHLAVAAEEAPTMDAIAALLAWAARIDVRLGTGLADLVRADDPQSFAEAVGRAWPMIVAGISRPEA